MNVHNSRFFQHPLVKKPLLKLYVFVWRLINHSLPDRTLLSFKYFLSFHKKLNWNSPQTYSEKIQWLKLYGRTKDNALMCDKYAVKQYVSDLIGSQYVIPLLGVWDSPEEIDFNRLPDRFVLKCNHNSGLGMCICKDKSKLDINQVRLDLKKGLKEDYFIPSRDYCYKDIPRKIIAETYMEDSKTGELRDYKFFCFDGEPKIFFIASGRSKGEHDVTFDFYDMDFNHLPFTNGHPNSKEPLEKPSGFEEMKRLAAKLSIGMPHVRVDFYEANGQVYFGEFTFSHWGGLKPFKPDVWDRVIGDWIVLPSSQN